MLGCVQEDDNLALIVCNMLRVTNKLDQQAGLLITEQDGVVGDGSGRVLPEQVL